MPARTSSKVSLKQFWETPEKRWEECSAEQLREIVRSMARDVKPDGQQFFPDRLKKHKSGVSPEQAVAKDRLLDDIEQLADEIREAGSMEPDYERYAWRGYSLGDEEYSLPP